MKKILFLCAVLVTGRLCAVNSVAYTEGVSFSTRIVGTGSGVLTVYDETGSPASSGSVSSGDFECDVGTAWLRPNKTYAVNFQSTGITQHYLSFTAPTGYTVYLDGAPIDLLAVSTGSGSVSEDYHLEIRPIGESAWGAAGSFSGISLGKSVTWNVGLGGVRTGSTAGRIFFKEVDLTTSPASRDRLYYSAPNNYLQITAV